MINIICALQCEARPLIEHYRLQGNARHSAFRCYQNDEMRLVVCGVGKLAAATATAYLAALSLPTSDAWLNLGIAGHADREIGEPLLAHKLIDASSERQWFPAIVIPAPCASETLTTVDKPEAAYREETMVDMEATGFYAAASRFQSSELIHSLKVISDNRGHHSDNISEKSTSGLIHRNIHTLDSIITQLQQLVAQLHQIAQTPAEVYSFMEQWHFTAYQQNELRHLIRRWYALTPDTPPLPVDFSDYKNSKAVIKAIREQLDNRPIRFDEACQ